jgi:hypothetical protein
MVIELWETPHTFKFFCSADHAAKRMMNWGFSTNCDNLGVSLKRLHALCVPATVQNNVIIHKTHQTGFALKQTFIP